MADGWMFGNGLIVRVNVGPIPLVAHQKQPRLTRGLTYSISSSYYLRVQLPRSNCPDHLSRSWNMLSIGYVGGKY